MCSTVLRMLTQADSTHSVDFSSAVQALKCTEVPVIVSLSSDRMDRAHTLLALRAARITLMVPFGWWS